MMLEFTVGINIAGESRSVTVSAEDALIAALKVKHQEAGSGDQLRAAQQQTRRSASSPQVGRRGRLGNALTGAGEITCGGDGACSVRVCSVRRERLDFGAVR